MKPTLCIVLSSGCLLVYLARVLVRESDTSVGNNRAAVAACSKIGGETEGYSDGDGLMVLLGK
jgi:hypothetical protein